MANGDFQESIQGNNDSIDSEFVSNEEIIKEIEADNEKEYFGELKKKNREFLMSGLSVMEKERIAGWIIDRYNEALPKHKELCDKIDKYDEVYRMERCPIQGDDDGEMPNYRSPLSTVTLEVMHANIMNIFFTPKDIMRVLPTEEGDVPKVNKLTTFGNWSMDNEMNIFEQVDRLFHSSDKNGESPYCVHWVKEFGMDIEREFVRNPADPKQILFDPDTKEPIFQEVEKSTLLYNAPRLEVFSRKDYIQPVNATMDNNNEWDMRIIRKTYDASLREELQGKFYEGSVQKISNMGMDSTESNKLDKEDDAIPLGRWENEFVTFYGRMRVNIVKNDDEDKTAELQELEDEFIAVVHISSRTLCQFRKNKFPLKMRPIGVDYFIPDDEGRRSATGIFEMLDSLQTAYDALFNQYIFGVIQSNSPSGFVDQSLNSRKESIKMKAGYLHFVNNPSGINFMKIPPPDASMNVMFEMINQFVQLLFGISDFTAGVESRIDPDAPAKKAEIVVAQGNVRLNALIKRKNKTLKDIFKRWYLLYKANMPPNKFMRVVGDSTDSPFRFDSVTLEDFNLKSLPDFELTGNILNSNKSLEINKSLAIYQVLTQNPFFSPQTRQGLQALHQLTKWLIDKLDEIGLSSFLPDVPGDNVSTPEEENARFLQGDEGEPVEGEDHVNHIRVHRTLLLDPTLPDEVKQLVINHINAHVDMQRQEITKQLVLSEANIDPAQIIGGQNGNRPSPNPEGQITDPTSEGILPGQNAGVGGFEG